jgi:hypothetical protein
MMTDRELLELAAKAAGDAPSGVSYTALLGIRQWNPIDNSGDALLLAVQLEMQVSIGFQGRINVAVYLDRGVDALPVNIREVKSDDPLAATRRAITRAAAEIGRSMK